MLCADADMETHNTNALGWNIYWDLVHYIRRLVNFVCESVHYFDYFRLRKRRVV